MTNVPQTTSRRADRRRRGLGTGLARLRRIGRSLVATARRVPVRAADVRYLYRGLYRPVLNDVGLSVDRLGIPLTEVSLRDATVIHTFDFLPDRLTFSGRPFREGLPYVDFAKEYVADPNFDHRQTAYYRLALLGRLPAPGRGAAEAQRRCRDFRYLIRKVQCEGYQPEAYGAISLVECVNGDLMVLNGKHRLAALMALNVERIPVALCFENEIRAIFRHVVERSWPPRFYTTSRRALASIGRPLCGKEREIRDLVRFIKGSQLETSADLYHPLPFADFRDLTTQVSGTTPYRRLGMILSRVDAFRGRRVLDIGCNVGFYAFSLAKRGATVTAVDVRREYADIVNRVAAIYEVPVRGLSRPASADLVRAEAPGFDIALCFSALQWIIRKEGEAFGGALLKAIAETCEMLFFDIAVNTGKACLSARPGDELAFVYRLLRRSTSYRTIEHIGDVHPYGTDTRHVFYCGH